MRRPNRNVEVFSISALDLFASALGAFIIVAIILFPYYLKSQEVRAEVDNLKSELEAAKTELEEAQSALENATSSLEEKATELEGVQSQLTAAKIELSKTFLVVGIDWATSGADIDLHVTDPDGNTFYYSKHNRNGENFPGTKAQLSYDMLGGPGIELWQAPAAKPGIYKIEYNPYHLPRGGSAVTVKGSIFERGGRIDLNPVSLRRVKEKVLAATVTIDSEGNISVRQ